MNTQVSKLRFDSAHGDRYLHHLDSVAGWLDKFSAEVILTTSAFQNESGFHGAVAEIGVHHGKLFLLAYLTTKVDERALAIDVFGLQHLNVDKSGCGNKAVFLRQLRKWAGSTDKINLIEDSSLNVEPRDVLAMVGRIRLFSIDGSHTEEATTHDIHLAVSVLTEEGVVVLDDCFNEYWPEVSAAIARYLTDRPGVVPFAITPGKVFLCGRRFKPFYQAMLRERFPRRIDKTARLYGHDDVQIVGVRPWTLTRAVGQTRLGGHLKDTRLGQKLKAMLPQ
jgi:hypothetical protein